jgi:subtilisin family serine protease
MLIRDLYDVPRRPSAAAQGDRPHPLTHIPGEYLVRFHPQALRAALTETTTDLTNPTPFALARDSNGWALLQYLKENHGLRAAEAVYADVPSGMALMTQSLTRMAGLLAQSVTRVERPVDKGYTVLRFASGTGAAASLQRLLARSDEVSHVEPVPARWLSAVRRPDPRCNRQWSLRAIGLFGTRLPGARRVPVAVLDSGIDRNHPLLPPSVIAHYDHDGLSPDDLEGHGTHVAGTIAALHDDAIGCSGIADCPMHIWKVIHDRPAADGRRYVSFGAYLRALAAVGDSGARVLNLSLGGTARSQTEAAMFRRLHAADVFVVAAMGNEFEIGNPVEYPAAYGGVHGIAAVDELDRRAPFSNTGPHAFLAAPGVNILSTAPTTAPASGPDDPAFDVLSGTSMATPHVAAVAALVRAAHPDWDVRAVARHLASTARAASGQRQGRRTHAFGHGIVDLPGALS